MTFVTTSQHSNDNIKYKVNNRKWLNKNMLFNPFSLDLVLLFVPSNKKENMVPERLKY